MSEHEGSAARAVYDHEVDEPHLGRRRAVADWGVGEEMFDHLPRRRRRGTEGTRRRERRGAVDEQRPRRFDAAAEEPVARGVEPRLEEPPARRFEPAVDDAAARSFEPPADESAASEPSAYEPAPYEPAPIAPLELAPEPPAAEPAPAPLPEGRRTVVIRGRGAEPQWTPRRPRPPRTVGERIGPRPDRVAAWAVALGMLLILIAILTAHG